MKKKTSQNDNGSCKQFGQLSFFFFVYNAFLWLLNKHQGLEIKQPECCDKNQQKWDEKIVKI